MDEELEPPVDPIECAACGSPNIRRRPRAIYFAVVAIIAFASGLAAGATDVAFYVIGAAAIFAMVADRWVCDDCGESWT